jgi:hypothetical protein
MSILPVGIRKEMQTQMFRMAQQSAPPEPSSAYMQTGVSAPSKLTPQLSSTVSSSSEKHSEDSDIREFVTSILVHQLGVPQRIVDKKLDNLVKYSIGSNGDVNGFFIIPVHTGQKKVSLSEAQKVVSEFCKKFNVDCSIEHGKNFKVNFKSVPKNDPKEISSDNEGSLQFVPDEKGNEGNKKVASNIFEEQLENRKLLLVQKLKELGYIK